MDKASLKAGASAPAIVTRRMGFGDDLTCEDRKMLRAVVRKVHRRYFADYPSDRDCDQLIEALGPEAQKKMLLAALKADGH